MSAQLDTGLEPPARREGRQDAVRIVEYTRFPRIDPVAGPRFAFTRDYSRSGMCVGGEMPEPAGALLRLSVRDVDGSSSNPHLQRVVWCEPAGDGRYWLGLERVTDS